MKKYVVAFVALVCLVAVSAFAQNKVVFDNQSGEPALVKLIGPTQTQTEVPNGAKAGADAAAGRYIIKVRYGTPGKYHYAKGQEFEVTETATTRSETTITLHKVTAGNYESAPIGQGDFDEEGHKVASPPAPPQVASRPSTQPTAMDESDSVPGAVAAIVVLQGDGPARLTSAENDQLNAFAATNKVSSKEGKLAYVRRLQEIVGTQRAAKMEVRFYDGAGLILWAWPHAEIDAVTFMKAFEEGKADGYKGFLVHAGGATSEGGTEKGKGGHATVLIAGKRPNGVFYPIARTSETEYSFNFDGWKDKLFHVLLLFEEGHLPQGYESGSVLFSFDMRKLCADFRARFWGTYSEVTLSQSGQEERKVRVPVLVWEGNPGKQSDARPRGTAQ